MIDIVFEAGEGSLRALVLEGDAVPSHRHQLAAVTAEHDVALGVEVTDHYRRTRSPVTVSVVISDAPLADGAREHTRRADAWRLLSDALDGAWPAIVTAPPIPAYEDVYLTEAATEFTAADGSWMRLELTFMPIRQVSTELVADTLPDRDRRTTTRTVATQEPTETDISAAAVLGFSLPELVRGGS